MQRKVAIVATAQVNSANIGMPRERMLFDLATGLYDATGITRHDIDTFVLCSNDFQTGHTISNVFEDCPVGAYMKDETKVEADGLWAATYGLTRILAGTHDTALVIGQGMGGSVFRPYLIMDYILPAVYERNIGVINELSAAALQARAYMDEFGVVEDDFNEISAAMLRNAAGNPDSFNGNAKATASEVGASEYLYEPLRLGHCYPWTDGACALLLAEEKRAKELTDKPVWIRGVGDSMDSFYPERDVVRSKSVRLAGERACGMAGINPGDLDVAEVSAKFAHQLPIICEGLGLSKQGSGAKALEAKAAVCPSGGAMGAYAFSAAGLVRLAECVKQLTGSAGDTQVSGAKTALAHGQDGFCAQHNAVMVLSTEEG